MSIRAGMRYVVHMIAEHPDAGVTFEAECLHCGWKATPADAPAPIDVECMSHTGRSSHAGFRRIRTSFAMVVRAE
ncbi:hypothetical protein ACFXDH_50455 [Streptomyces sp. NPDC059467]|uniref:DUF7848 domain-containing protein n=1 Tax=Streptomyces sp. NPDC059467 TaxID=3346844 RepID=UPI0036973D98